MMAEDMTANARGLALGWVLPAAALVGAISLEHPAKTLVWSAALVWMGAACIANARHCRRTHCYFTAPFFLVLAVLAPLHGFDLLSLGAQGWLWLGLTLVLGTAVLWIASESLLGRYWLRGSEHAVDR